MFVVVCFPFIIMLCLEQCYVIIIFIISIIFVSLVSICVFVYVFCVAISYSNIITLLLLGSSLKT
jgi:hypothetical protein